MIVLQIDRLGSVFIMAVIFYIRCDSISDAKSIKSTDFNNKRLPPVQLHRLFRNVRSADELNRSGTERINNPVLTTSATPLNTNITKNSTVPPALQKTTVVENTNVKLNEIIINEICDEEVISKGNGSSYGPSRKERLLCALLKMEMDDRISNKNKIEEQLVKPNENEAKYYLPKDYNKEEAPYFSSPLKLPNGTTVIERKPSTCYTYLNIRSVSDMDEAKEEVTLDLDVIVLWIDGHIFRNLKMKNVTMDKFTEVERNLKPISSQFADKVWLPDIFFEEVVSVGRPIVLDKGGKTVLFNPNLGAIFLRSRLLITLHCDMNFIHYPLDTQKCQFHLRSASQSSSDLVLKWWRGKAFGVYLHETSDPNFDYQVSTIKEYDEAPDLGPETRKLRPSSYLWFEICIRRKMSYHLLQTYLPSVFFLIVTWLCFLIPSKLFEARVGVAMTTLLTQTSMFSSIRESTPAVGYVKAIDIWMVVCIFFIFFALFAFVCEAWVRHLLNVAKSQKDEMEKKDNRLISSTENVYKNIRLYATLDKLIDKYTALALSLLFILFNILYWTWLLNDSEHLNWNVNQTFNSI